MVSHCFYNKAQIPQPILQVLYGLAPSELWPFSPKTLPHKSLPAATLASLLPTDVSYSFPSRALCVYFSSLPALSLNVSSGEASHHPGDSLGFPHYVLSWFLSEHLS